jgi:hypothetical protein
MLQIGCISALHEHKTQSLLQGDFARTAFEQTVGDICSEIQSGTNPEPSEGFSFSNLDFAIITNARSDSDPPTFVTYIFSSMVLLSKSSMTLGFVIY